MLKSTEQQVWVVTYDHKHGNDISVYDSERAAQEGIREMMRDSLMGQEYDESLNDIRAALDAGDVPTDRWRERFNEYFNYEQKTVATWADNLDKMAESIRESAQEPSSAATHPSKRRRRTGAQRTSR